MWKATSVSGPLNSTSGDNEAVFYDLMFPLWQLGGFGDFFFWFFLGVQIDCGVLGRHMVNGFRVSCVSPGWSPPDSLNRVNLCRERSTNKALTAGFSGIWFCRPSPVPLLRYWSSVLIFCWPLVFCHRQWSGSSGASVGRMKLAVPHNRLCIAYFIWLLDLLWFLCGPGQEEWHTLTVYATVINTNDNTACDPQISVTAIVVWLGLYSLFVHVVEQL